MVSVRPHKILCRRVSFSNAATRTVVCRTQHSLSGPSTFFNRMEFRGLDGARFSRCVDLRNRENRAPSRPRSEEHTSELQSHLNLVCRLLLEKKNKIN